MTSLPTSDRKRPRSVEAVIQALEDILRWMYCESYWLLKTELGSLEESLSRVGSICSSLCHLIQMDPEVAECFFFSTTATRLTLRLYTMKLQGSDNKYRVCVIRNIPSKGWDPTDVLAAYTKSTRGREVLIQALLSSSAAQKLFAESFSDRLDQLTEPFEHPAFTDPLDMAILPISSTTTMALSLSTNRHIHSLLQKHGYLRQWSKTIATICKRSTGLRALFSMTTDLVRVAAGCAGNTVRALADVIDGGILHPFFTALQRTLLKGSDVKCIEKVINTLVEYIHHRRTAAALRKLLNALPDHVQDRIKGHDVVGVMFWRLQTALERLDEHHLGLGMGGITRICDNLLHPSEKDTTYNIFNPPPPLKACSSCHLVVYCGTTCQQQDWARRHHQECLEMSKEHQVARSTGRKYCFSSRIFHIEYMATVVAKSLLDSTIRPTYKARDGSICLHHNGVQGKAANVIFMDTTISDREHVRVVSVSEFPIDEYLERRTRGDCNAMEQRVMELVELFKTKSLEDSSPEPLQGSDDDQSGRKPRLLEAIFTHGVGMYVSVVVCMEKRQGRWVVVQSVARILRMRGSPP